MPTKKKKKKGNQMAQLRCPYCGAHVIYRSADGIYRDNQNHTMLYVCSRYPECDAYVRVHAGTKIPVGSLANPELRKLRRLAHQQFNRLYESGYMSKRDAYQWLADLIDAPMSEAHIGHMGEYYCKLVIDKSEHLLEEHKRRRAKFCVMGGGKHEAKPGAEEKSRGKYRSGAKSDSG